MGRAQEVMRHGCGRIVDASGLCIPCIERDRTRVVLDDSMLEAKALTRADGLPKPYEGQFVAGFHVTTVCSDKSCTIACPLNLNLVVEELVVMASWGAPSKDFAPMHPMERLLIEDFQVGTLSYNASRAPIPCSTSEDGHRWKFADDPEGRALGAGRPRATPSVFPILRVRNTSATSIIVKAAVYGHAFDTDSRGRGW